jgi:hypothetical protein
MPVKKAVVLLRGSLLLGTVFTLIYGLHVLGAVTWGELALTILGALLLVSGTCCTYYFAIAIKKELE